MQHVFVVGSKGIPGAYGGYETFLDKLTEYHRGNPDIQYHVACRGRENGEFTYHHARCFKVKVPEIGAAQAVCYDIMALKRCCEYIRKNEIRHPVVYILACRIGPFIHYFCSEIHRAGGAVCVNPDGHEWMRKKWSMPVRKYWKFSEKLMVKHADLMICDSRNIETYIQKQYKKFSPETKYIAYGAETKVSGPPDAVRQCREWMDRKQLREKEYYLAVGRFVPENNFEAMIREFMRSGSKRDFAIITTVNEALFKKLQKKLNFREDKRIKFVGTVYEPELLEEIRRNAYGYIHGHEVGGTNPSLLEALAATDLNLLLDVKFNRETAGETAFYWDKKEGSLAGLIDRADRLLETDRKTRGAMARDRIRKEYSWEKIAGMYGELFSGYFRVQNGNGRNAV